MPTFTTPSRSNFSAQAQTFSSLGLKFKNIRPRETFEEISKGLFSDKLVLTFLVSWFFTISLAFGYVMMFFNNLPLQIPLFYSRQWGEMQLAEKRLIFLPVAGAFVSGLVSFVLASYTIRENKVLAYILSGAAPLTGLLAMITVLNIVNLMR